MISAESHYRTKVHYVSTALASNFLTYGRDFYRHSGFEAVELKCKIRQRQDGAGRLGMPVAADRTGVDNQSLARLGAHRHMRMAEDHHISLGLASNTLEDMISPCRENILDGAPRCAVCEEEPSILPLKG